MNNTRSRDQYIVIDGVSKKRDKRYNKPGIPDPQSNRSKKRASRGWKSLEESSRIHKRAAMRQAIACTIKGKMETPGERVQVATGSGQVNEHRAGGAVHFWKG